MKKLFLSIQILIGISFLSISQDNIEIKVNSVSGVVTNDNTDYSSGHSPYQVNTTEANDIVVNLLVFNNSTSDLTLNYKFYRNEETPVSWYNSYEIGSTCYPPPQYFPYCNPIRIIFIPAGGYSTFDFHISMDTPGNGGYKITFGPDCDSAIDSVMINGSFSANLKETKQIPTFSMHPNPANDLVEINTNSNDKATIKIVDLLGNVVFTDSFIGSTSVNTNDFKNGVYFVTTDVNGIKYSNRKLIIRH